MSISEMVDVLDMLRIAKDDTVRNVAAMDVLSNGKKRAIETDTPPPISKQILSYIFSKLSTPPSTPSYHYARKEATQLQKFSSSQYQNQFSRKNCENNDNRIDTSPNLPSCSCTVSVDHASSATRTHKNCLETSDTGKVFSFSEERQTDLDDVEGSQRSQEEKTSSSSNDQDVPSKYFRCLSIENDQGSHFLYGLVVPLVARILLVSCPNVICIVEVPVVEREKSPSHASSSDESFPSGNSSPEEGNVEFYNSSSSDSRGSSRLGNGEILQKEDSCSEKCSQRESISHGSFNCSFVKDPLKRERAARLISSSLEALTAKVQVPHHDGSEFTLSSVQPLRHSYIRDKRSRFLCGARVEYTNGSSCEVTVDDAFRVLALRRPDLNTPILLFTFDCDCHEQTFHECLGYRNSFIIDIKSSEKPSLGVETCDPSRKLDVSDGSLPKGPSSSKLVTGFNGEKDVAHEKDPLTTCPESPDRNRLLKTSNRTQESRGGEKRERSPRMFCTSGFTRESRSHKHAKRENDLHEHPHLCSLHGNRCVCSSLLETRFAERCDTSFNSTLTNREDSHLMYNMFPQYLSQSDDQNSAYFGQKNCATSVSSDSTVANPYILGYQSNMYSLQAAPLFSVMYEPNTASSGPVFSAPIGGFVINSLYSGGFHGSSYGPMPFTYHATPQGRENYPWHGCSAEVNANQQTYDALSSGGYHGFDWNNSSKSSIFSRYYGNEQVSSVPKYFSPKLQSFTHEETRMSYMDKVHKWYEQSRNLLSENVTKQSPEFRGMRSPTLSDTVLSSPKNSNVSSDDDSSVRKVASEALAMLAESVGDENNHPYDEIT